MLGELFSVLTQLPCINFSKTYFTAYVSSKLTGHAFYKFVRHAYFQSASLVKTILLVFNKLIHMITITRKTQL